MKTIFEIKNELFKIENGFILFVVAKKKFNKDLFILISNIVDEFLKKAI